MPQMDLQQAQQIIERVAENPDGSQDLSTREIAEASAVVLVRNVLLPPARPTDG